MPRTKKVITGQVIAASNEDKDLGEIISGRKESKFFRYPTRESYEAALKAMGHFELCEELLRIGEVPSSDSRICFERCVNKYEATKRRKASRQLQQIGKTGRDLREIIENT